MKIIKLDIHNFKKIKAVEISPKGSVVQVRGKNGAGKSSCLDAIASVLGGKDLAPKEPIRRGSKTATVRVELDDDFVAERTWAISGGSTLTLKNKEGLKYDKPQKRLDDIIGRLTFDPLAFTRLEPKQQADTLRALAGIDFTGLDDQRRAQYDNRTVANRQVDQLRARLAALPEVDAPDESVSGSDLIAELQRRSEQVTANNWKRGELEAVRSRFRGSASAVDDLKKKIADLQDDLAVAEERHEENRTRGQALKTEAEALKDPNLDEIKEKLRDVESTNECVRQKKARVGVANDLELAVVEAKALDNKIKEIDAQKEKALSGAKFTVSGLAFTDDGVTFGGLPLEQASQAEQLRISVSIGAALNPKLRAMLVRDGSLLDEDSLALLTAEAEKANLQVFLETVSIAGDGILIVDGEVKDTP